MGFFWIRLRLSLFLSTPIRFAMGQADGMDKGFATAHLFLFCGICGLVLLIRLRSSSFFVHPDTLRYGAGGLHG